MTVHWVTNNSKGNNKDGATTTRMKNMQTADAKTMEMTFDDQETFTDKADRYEKKTVQIPAPYPEEDDASSSGSSGMPPQSNTSTIPLRTY
jgi:hypothetical protein